MPNFAQFLAPPIKILGPKTAQNLAFFLPHLTLCVHSFVRRQIFCKKLSVNPGCFPYEMTRMNLNNFNRKILQCGV